MAVAVKNTPEMVTRKPLNRLAVESLLGVAYVLGTIGIVFYLLPWIWAGLGTTFANIGLNAAVQTALLILAMVLVAGGLIYAGLRLAGSQPVHGLAAGIFLGVLGVLAAALVTCVVGNWLQVLFGTKSFLGPALTLLLGALLLTGIVVLFFRPRFDKWVLQLEDQGWFTMAAYKRSQGQRVRRGTILGLLLLAGAGIYTMINHRTLGSGVQNWQVKIPFTDGLVLTILPNIQYTVPLLLVFGSIWLAYRVVNLPVFADFLIATEAELNKVSWTTRKRLVQDTIVVLVTVVLLTIFLFLVDQLWAWLLTKVGVLQLAPPSGGAGGPKELPW
jgi:preprotein translocase SecE subunit